ncbi:MAG: MMPL family transporter [Myxococcales bacterium]|nr:MMPL family transporter [Myxococcales bacterium]
MAIRDRIEVGFERWGRLVFRYRWAAIVLMLALASALTSRLPLLTLDNSIESFLHEDDPAVLLYNDFRDQFGWDEYIFILLEPREVFDLLFLEELKALHEELETEVPYLDDVTSLLNARSTRGEKDELIVEDLLEEWPETPDAMRVFRERVFANPLYLHTLISENGRFTTITLKPDTYSTLQEIDALAGFDDGEMGEALADVKREFLTEKETALLIKSVREVMARHEGPQLKLYLVGGAVLGDRMNEEMQSDLAVFLGVSLLIIMAVLYLVFRRASGVILPLVVVLLSLLSTLGIMVMLGIPLSLTTEILPSFLLAVGVCDSVHLLVIFYRQWVRGSRREDAIAYAMGHAGLAILMTSLTTAGGLASFAAAELAPVAYLGVVAPVGVMLAFVFSVVLLPALLGVVPLRRAQHEPGSRNAWVERLLIGVGDFSSQRPWTIVAVSALVLALGGLGASRVRFSQNELEWFPEQEPLREAMAVFDRELKGALTLELLVQTGEENGLHLPELLQQIEALGVANQSFSYRGLFIGKTISITDVVKETHQALNENRADFYTIPDNRQLIAQELLLFENSGTDDLEDLTDSQFSMARVSMKVPWADSMLYPEFLARMEHQIEAILGEHAQLSLTGLSPLLGRTFSAVVTTMGRSYVLALLIITPMMVFLLGSFRRGLLSMIPNLAPVLMTLGLMGWLGVALDMSSLLIGGIILGLAVDDTIHFMYKFGRYHQESGDPYQAVRETMQTTGTAMLFTSLVLSAGFLVFVLAYMSNISSFGLLAAFATITAFVADVTLAPALMILITRRRYRPAQPIAMPERLVREGRG